MSILWLIVGLLLGSIITTLVIGKKKSIGTLRVDRSDPDDDPYLFLEINPGGTKSLLRDDYIMLKVKRENYISRS